MRVEPAWLTPEMAIEINRHEVARTGEPFGVHADRLEGAIARPHQLWSYGEEDDALRLALQLFDGLNANHAFLQANKRTAWVSAVAFLALNGYELLVPDSDELGEFLTRASIREVSRAELEARLLPWISAIPI